MKKECPSCEKDFSKKLLRSKSLTRDEVKKTKEIVYVCPFCKAALVSNVHESEAKYKKIMSGILAVSLIPMFLLHENGIIYLSIIGVFCVFVISIIMIKNERNLLKDWPRWKIFNV